MVPGENRRVKDRHAESFDLWRPNLKMRKTDNSARQALADSQRLTAALMLEMAAATTAVFDWAEAAAPAVRLPDARAETMAWESRSATTVELVRSTDVALDPDCCKRRRTLPAIWKLGANLGRIRRSAVPTSPLPLSRAVPWATTVQI